MELKKIRANVVAAGKKQRAELQKLKRAIIANRASLAETIRYFCDADCPELAEIREFLGLDKSKNQKARKSAMAYVTDNLPYYIEVICTREGGECDEIEVTGTIKVPATKNGKERKDYLQVILDLHKSRMANLAQRRKLAELARANGNKIDFDKLPKSLQQVLTTKFASVKVGERVQCF